MKDSNDVQLWTLMAYEYADSQSPVTGDTLLHVAARTDKHFAIDLLMNCQVNPFKQNKRGEIPTNERLVGYRMFKTTKVHMRWRGPYFRMRVWTLLCIILRWRTTKVRFLSKDVANIILRHMAQIENV
jgi:hypothetical protein